MSDILKDKIYSEIDIDRDHIEKFPLETDEGTKKIKEKYHKKAINDRNNYIKKQINIFKSYGGMLYDEMEKRFNNLMPKDKSFELSQNREGLKKYEDLIELSSEYIDNDYLLGFSSLLSKLKEGISLNSLNEYIDEYFKRMSAANITLTIEDFKYSMFTEIFMKSYFEKTNTSETFQKIFYECPDIITHLRMNLEFILTKYKKNIDTFVTELKTKELTRFNTDSKKVVLDYVAVRERNNEAELKDEFTNTNIFLDKRKNIIDYLDNAPLRVKNFDQLAGNYAALGDEEKAKFKKSIIELSDAISEMKEYYHYEFLIKDLIKKFNERSTFVPQYNAKLKEIAKEEGNREKIYKDYLKSLGIGFLAKENREKQKICKMKMNEQINNLNKLYGELKDLEVYSVIDKLSEACSIYDLFAKSFLCYDYLEKMFIDNLSEDEAFHLDGEFKRYFMFLYNPSNEFLRKINAVVDYDISTIIADKYKLLGLNITAEELISDNIDVIREVVNYIRFVYNVEDSNISFIDIDFMCKFSNLQRVEDIEII